MLTNKTEVATLQPLISLYDLHSTLFKNVTDGVSGTDSNNRLHTKANHPSWIAGSIVHQRYDLPGLWRRLLGYEAMKYQ